RDPTVPPPAILGLHLLASVQLHCIPPTCFRIGNAPVLHHDDLALARASWVSAEKTPRSVRDAAIHRLPDHLGNEEARLWTHPISDRLFNADCASAPFRRDRK